ncbi:hypothetical protein [Rhizobium grahamii]|uniref:Uncharacterized protein n=1 Tax=Rhizobium grahamii TaxID=1120045 RepID=A0A370KGY6_9HYPH|nr:hypothetical protein [Rhizobium grahamii]RDJ04213.1 hypothetical protein B5K06_27505 [Rhizobium grahamii]
MNICVKPSFDVATYLDHAKATHKRMISPGNAVKDTALPRYHRVEAEEQHDDKPLLQFEQGSGTETLHQKIRRRLKRIAEIQDNYFPGISASEIADRHHKKRCDTFYRRNPDELRSYPLVASPGAKAGARRKGRE